jgi:hypothetical protein
LNRQKSIVSQAASISAWNAVLDWPSIVAALSVDRHRVVRSSAAFRKMAARSSQLQADQSRCASAAAAIACSTCSADALCQSARTWRWSWGMTACAVRPVRTSRPPITRGMSTFSAAMSSSRAFSSARSGEPGA